MIKILPCECKNKYQDDTYGKGKRVHNQTADKTSTWRCTVCGKEKN